MNGAVVNLEDPLKYIIGLTPISPTLLSPYMKTKTSHRSLLVLLVLGVVSVALSTSAQAGNRKNVVKPILQTTTKPFISNP